MFSRVPRFKMGIAAALAALSPACSHDDGQVADAAVVMGASDGATDKATLNDGAPAERGQPGVEAAPDLTEAAPAPDGAAAPDAAVADSGVDASSVTPGVCVTSAPIPGTIFFSRAGRNVATDDGIVCSVTGDGSDERLLAEGKAPRLSPSGRYILFHAGNAAYNRANILMLDRQTGIESMVFGNNDYSTGFAFTPDESHVVFDYFCEIDSAKLPDGTERKALIPSFVDCYSDSPAIRMSDGAIVFHNAHVGLALSNAAGTTVAMIPNTAPGDYFPQFSPDGQWITFSRWKDNPRSATLIKIRPDGTGLAVVGTITDQVEGGAITPDGRWLVEYGVRDGVRAFYGFDLTGVLPPIRMCPPALDQAIEFVGSIQ